MRSESQPFHADVRNASSCSPFSDTRNEPDQRRPENVKIPHRQDGQGEDDANHDVEDHLDVVHDDGEAGLRTGSTRCLVHVAAIQPAASDLKVWLLTLV